MKSVKAILALLITLGLLVSISCSEDSSSSSNNSNSHQSTSPPTTPTQPTPTTTVLLQFTDETNDIFDNNRNPIQSELYLDIVEVEVLTIDDNYVFRMTVNNALPQSIDSTIALEWDFFLDTDRDSATGWSYPIACNDTGPEYVISLNLEGTEYVPLVLYTATDQLTRVVANVNDNILEISFNTSIMPLFQSFDFVAAVRKWVKDGDRKILVELDKTPDTGHNTYIRD